MSEFKHREEEILLKGPPGLRVLASEWGETGFLVRKSQGSSKIRRVKTQKVAWLGGSELKKGGKWCLSRGKA